MPLVSSTNAFQLNETPSSPLTVTTTPLSRPASLGAQQQLSSYSQKFIEQLHDDYNTFKQRVLDSWNAQLLTNISTNETLTQMETNVNNLMMNAESLSGSQGSITSLEPFQNYEVYTGQMFNPYLYVPTIGVWDYPLASPLWTILSDTVDSQYQDDFRFTLNGTYNQFVDYTLTLWNASGSTQTAFQVCFYFYTNGVLRYDKTVYTGNVLPHTDSIMIRLCCKLDKGHTYDEVKVGVKSAIANTLVIGAGSSSRVDARGSYWTLSIHNWI